MKMGAELAKVLDKLGHIETRQTGSHLRLTSNEGGEHHITVPLKRTLPLGTLRSILRDIAPYTGVGIGELCWACSLKTVVSISLRVASAPTPRP